MNNKPSTEERIWAVLSHVAALAMGIGLPLPILGWSQSRRKSNCASFQSLQALGYQTLGYTIWILILFVAIVVQILDTLTKLIVAAESGANVESLTNMVMGRHFPLLFLLMAVYFALPVTAAIACAFGMDFRYPLIGNRLAHYLGYYLIRASEEQTWLIEEHEDRWVAATGHFAVIIVFWGLLAPVFAWAMQGKRSLFLKFQSIQTVLYQVGITILYFVAGFLCMFGLVVFIVTIGFQETVSLDSSGNSIGTIVFLASLLIAMLILLIVPLLHILGQWAGYRVLKGDEYRYPIVGRMVERWVAKKTPPGTAAKPQEE
jgi:uncharacterized Tic20 family protein